jgi:hypothetical protein
MNNNEISGKLLTSQLNNQKIMEIKSAKNQKVWVGESYAKQKPNQ